MVDLRELKSLSGNELVSFVLHLGEVVLRMVTGSSDDGYFRLATVHLEEVLNSFESLLNLETVKVDGSRLEVLGIEDGADSLFVGGLHFLSGLLSEVRETLGLGLVTRLEGTLGLRLWVSKE